MQGVSLKFLAYHDKHYSIKRAVLDFILRRDTPPPANEFWALKEINLVIRKGERVGILGHNGAGKSTLLRLIARIYAPTSGILSIRGSVAPLIEMGAGFHPELSGRENILLNGSILGMSRKELEDRIPAIWDFTELHDFAEMPLKYYSSGMAVRLAFAIATEVNPDILLLDEALSPGDASFVDKAKARMRSLMERSNVVILVSHDLAALCELCTRGIWLVKGRIVADGPIHEVVHQYVEAVARGAAASHPPSPPNTPPEPLPLPVSA
jgi:ABC-type polysaccharide/polyol phosphate transport system ATPase subunit